MTETLLLETDATPPTAAPPKAPRRGGGARVLAVLVLLALIAWLGWTFWNRSQTQARDAAAWQQESTALRERIETLDTALSQLRRAQQANADRLDATAATNRVLREELLGMGERAALLEDAVARLADQRLRGETVLRLNEAEFLLLLGAERLRLFGDPASAIQAFALAEASLASLDDPALAILRQTLAQELIELRSVPPDPRPQLRAELSALSTSLASLPPTRHGEIVATDARDSRLARLLSQLVTVRHVSERDAVLGPVQRDAALAAVRLQLELAQAALARPDPDAFRTAIAQVREASGRLFDRNETAGAAYFARLDSIAKANLLPELPALGATLGELRGLRATRTVGQDDAVPAPAAPSDTATLQDSATPALPTPPSGTPAQSGAPAPTSNVPPLPDVERAPADADDGAGDVE